MPKLAKHLDILKPSATLALNTRARELRARKKKVWNFSVGEPDLTSPAQVVEAAIASLKTDPIRYGSAGGGVALRDAIVHKLKRENRLSYNSDQIVCGVGAKQVLYHLMHGLLDPDDELLVHTPCWTSYKEQVSSARGKTATIPYLHDDPFAPEYIESFTSEKTKAILLCSPNNPAGYVIPSEKLAALGEYLKTKDWWIISDEIYEYYSFTQKHRSIVEFAPELADRYIHINGVSKSFAMTGWRMGYLAGPASVAKRVKTLISHSSTCLPTFVEKAAEVAINTGMSLMGDYQKELIKRKELASNLISQIDHIQFLKPEGAFYLFIDVQERLARAKGYNPKDCLKLSNHLLEQVQVSTVAGEVFLCPGHLRLSYAVNETDLKEGIERMADCLAKL